MKVFDAGEGRVLIVREQDQVHAMGTKCTHYGAPLNTGIFCKGKVYCPWHGACFNAKTGTVYIIVTYNLILDHLIIAKRAEPQNKNN